jgi:hypothetical protein
LIDIQIIETLLETYTLEEVLSENDLTEADALHFLVEQEFITLPNPRPL